MFQQQNNLLPNLYEEKFTMANKYHIHNTRNSQCLRSTFLKLDNCKNSIFDQGVKILNNLPSESKVITSKTKFKAHQISSAKQIINILTIMILT